MPLKYKTLVGHKLAEIPEVLEVCPNRVLDEHTAHQVWQIVEEKLNCRIIQFFVATSNADAFFLIEPNIKKTMKTDKQGCSTTKPCEEQYEIYVDGIGRKLFSTVAPYSGLMGLDEARKRRDRWLEENDLELILYRTNKV